MKRLLYALLSITISILSFNCQKEISYTGPSLISSEAKDPITASLQGTVFDESNQPAAGVSVRVGTKTAITNTRGYFRIPNASLDKYVSMVTAEKAGYFKAIRTFSGTSGTNQVMIKLTRKEIAGTINANSGGEVSLSNGAKIAIPAKGVVTAQTGSIFNGSVTVYAAYIDPTSDDIGTQVPGSFLANDMGNKRVVLTSYGMMAVELASASGEILQIADGKTATLTTPIPASISNSAPSSIPLWYLDEQTGLWKQEGQAIKTGSVYTGEVKHFSYWNCDVSGPTVNFFATFVNPDGVPMSSVYVKIKPAIGNGSSAHGYTDTLGQVSGPIPANTNLILEVRSNTCNTIVYSQNIGPYSSSVSLGTIVIPNTPAGPVTVKGKILKCDGSPVTNGFAMIYYNYIIRYVPVNGTGEFSTAFIPCSAVPPTCEVYGVDLASGQQGSMVSFPVIIPVTNTGNISACGTSTDEFINYVIDGNSYSVNSMSGDTVSANYANFGGLLPYQVWLLGSRHPDRINLNFRCDPAAGNYPLLYLWTKTYQRTRIESPLLVSLTNFPAAPGNFFEGSFTGQFRDSADLVPLHSINCSFRIKRH
jgi:hypothetical protein